MSTTIYLCTMLAVIAAVTALSVPALFLQKCPACGRRNVLDAAACRRCGKPVAQSDE